YESKRNPPIEGVNQSGRRRPGQLEMYDGGRHPRMQNHRKQQNHSGHEYQRESVEPLLEYVEEVSRMAGVHVIGDVPDRVERIPQFSDGGRSPQEQSRQAKKRRNNAALWRACHQSKTGSPWRLRARPVPESATPDAPERTRRRQG